MSISSRLAKLEKKLKPKPQLKIKCFPLIGWSTPKTQEILDYEASGGLAIIARCPIEGIDIDKNGRPIKQKC